MKIYRIFLKKTKDGIIEDLEIIKEGFCLKAAILNLFYLLYKKLWKQSLLLLVIVVFLTLLEISLLNLYIIAISIKICIFLHIGFEYVDWISDKLTKDGYDFLGHSLGENEKEAKLKFLDAINQDSNTEKKLKQEIF